MGILSTCYEMDFSWIPQNPIGDWSTLVRVMACCRQAASHYLNQCWPKSMSPYVVTGTQYHLNTMRQKAVDVSDTPATTYI